MAAKEKENNARIVRWYVLTLPPYHRNVKELLDGELSRRSKYAEPSFEYFAPTYVAVVKKNGLWVKTKRPLLLNYILVKASESEIYRMMLEGMHGFSFLPRVRTSKQNHYPYLTEREVENLRYVAKAYSNELPLYSPAPERLLKGDKIRINAGPFKGAEAIVLNQAGAGTKDIYISLGDACIPLINVRRGEYEVIALSEEGQHKYTKLHNERLPELLHQALSRLYSGQLTEKDKEVAGETLREYSNLQMDSNVTRCRLYSLLLPAYTLMGDAENRMRIMGEMLTVADLLPAPQTKAMLYLSLYGATDNGLYREKAHELIDPWKKESAPKKHKKELMRRLADYDRWFGHHE